ncbi:MAG: electron transfer flavoprotein subunit alpha/FixB family protein [Oligoflexia bacterium]|nr:electron transfer flavoprotein subunit alpha/FixB family protein [Oligoflexia bacterium]
MSENNILVFIENNNGNVNVNVNVLQVSLELISKATELAKTLNVKVCGVILGFNFHLQNEMLENIAHYGLDEIYVIDDPRLKHFTSIPYAKAISALIRKLNPNIVLFGATTTGRDIAPRIASELKCGLTADCTDLQLGEYTIKNKTYQNTLLQIRPAFGGNIMATIVSPDSSPSMATVREGVMRLNSVDPNKKAIIVNEKLSDLNVFDSDFQTEVVEIILKEKSVDLKNAKIIVAAGMGASSEGAITLIKDLARTLGGEVAGSRPVIDAGVLTKDHQVGQTGITVRPTLYIACGISGQIQHRAGMEEAKRILAINKDPNAPIFSIAHYSIVGDVMDVIPKIISAYKNKL